MAEKEPEPAESPDPFDIAVKNIREVANRVTLAFGAIATVVVGTSPLSNFGKLDLFEWRWWIATVSLGVALGGIGWILRFVIKIESAGEVSLGDLAGETNDSDTTYIAKNPSLLGGYPSVKHLEQDFNAQVDGQFRAINAGDQAAMNAHNAKAMYLSQAIISPLLSVVRYHRVKTVFDGAKNLILLAAFIAGLAVAGFLWAANPPDEPSSPSPFRAPTHAQLIVDDDEEAARINALMGASCEHVAVGAAMPVTLLGISDESADVITVPDPNSGCDPRRLTVDRSNVAPVVPVATPASA